MRPDTDFSECLACSCFAARRAARAITQHFERHLKPSGLTVGQFTALAVLSLAGPLPLTRLADELAVERTTLTRNLRTLLDQGWVSEVGSGDRRVRRLEVTRQGIAAARAALPYWHKAQKSIAGRLGGDAIRALAEASKATAQMTAGRRQ